MKEKIGAIILAAGSASRMGRQKLLLPLAGQPLLAHVLRTVCSLVWAECVAVIGQPQAELAAVCEAANIPWVYNTAHCQGQSSSIRLGLQQLPEQLDGIMFFVGDQPLVPLDLVAALLMQFARTGSRQAVVVPCCQGQRYSPVLFGSYWRGALAGLRGDIGGRQIMRDNPAQVVAVDWPEPAAFYDADTWEEYGKLKEIFTNLSDYRQDFTK